MRNPLAALLHPIAALVQLVTAARLSEPVRLYLYGFGSVVLTGLVLAGWITSEWEDYTLLALGVILSVPPGAELARRGVYSPRTLSEAGVLDLPGRHSPEVRRALLLAAAVRQADAERANRTDTIAMRPVRATP